MKAVVSTPIFFQTSLGVFFLFGALFSWFTVGPALLIKGAGITPVEFGFLNFVFGGVMFAGAGFLNAKLVLRFGMHRMMTLGAVLVIASGIGLIVLYTFFSLSLWLVFGPVLLFIFGSTLVWPNAFAVVMTPFGNKAGYAGSMYSLFQMGGGGVVSALVAFLPDTNPIPLGMVYCLCGGLAFYCFMLNEKR